jgi:hypothetical protein
MAGPGKPGPLVWTHTTCHILHFKILLHAPAFSQTLCQTLSRKEHTFSHQTQSLDEVVQAEMYFLH